MDESPRLAAARRLADAIEELTFEAIAVLRRHLHGPDTRRSFRAADSSLRVYCAQLRHGAGADEVVDTLCGAADRLGVVRLCRTLLAPTVRHSRTYGSLETAPSGPAAAPKVVASQSRQRAKAAARWAATTLAKSSCLVSPGAVNNSSGLGAKP